MFNETKILELRNSAVLVLLNKYKTFGLRNSETFTFIKNLEFGKISYKVTI